MGFDFDALKRSLADNKVFDAWQYVESLRDTLYYMTISHEVLNAVYTHRVSTLNDVGQEILNKAISEGRASLCESDLEKTDLDISGYKIDDIIFLRKTVIDFFHYARVSIDILFQIINAALLGDESIAADKVHSEGFFKKLKSEPKFANLVALLDANKNNAKYEYLRTFDNYVKHVKTIPVEISNGILFGNKEVFEIDRSRSSKGIYPNENAIAKTQELYDYVVQTVETILNEVLTQIPNCLDNSRRVQTIKYKYYTGTPYYYVSFFIEVDNDLTDLPTEIGVLPLIIKDDGVHSFDFTFDKIFIKKKNTRDYEVLGCAHLKNGVNTNEFYRIFEIKPCTSLDYMMYTKSFTSTYANKEYQFNCQAMEGETYFITGEAISKPTDTRGEPL